jgi:hypothetical protein
MNKCDCNKNPPNDNKNIIIHNEEETLFDLTTTESNETCEESDNFTALFGLNCVSTKCNNKISCEKINKCVDKTICNKIDKCLDLTLCDKIDKCLNKNKCKQQFVWEKPCFTEIVPQQVKDRINEVGEKLTFFLNQIRPLILSCLLTGNFTPLEEVLALTPNIVFFIIRNRNGNIIFSA